MKVVEDVEIGPEAPKYRFVLRPVIPEDDSPDHLPLIGEIVGYIDVFKGNDESRLQTLSVESAHWSWLAQSFETFDINMDGFQDLRVIYVPGAKSHQHDYWMYEPGSQRFVTNAFTAAMRNIGHNGLAVDPEKKQIRTSHFIGICTKSSTIYQIEDEGPVPIESAIHLPEGPGLCKVEISKRVNGEMQLIEVQDLVHEE